LALVPAAVAAAITLLALAVETHRNPTLLQTIHALSDLEGALVLALVGASIEYRITTYVPELREPFEKADSCKELDALGSD